MGEHGRVIGEKVITDRGLSLGDNINSQASEAQNGELLLQPGGRLGFAQIALLATVGRHHVWVYRKPQVGIIATGDEIVDVGERPLEYQIRNSNVESLAVQVARAGGIPFVLPIARDNYESTHEIVARGLHCDMLLLSGGVSAGQYDIVGRVLAGFRAEFYFSRGLVQPSQ